jgi:hypothetical protein
LDYRYHPLEKRMRANGTVLSTRQRIELPDVEAARREALLSARDLVCQAIKAGKPTVPEAIVIADEAGRPLEVVPVAAQEVSWVPDRQVS